MATLRRDLRPAALNLIRAANELLREETTILASHEECDYFRSIYRSSREMAPERRPEQPAAPLLSTKQPHVPASEKSPPFKEKFFNSAPLPSQPQPSTDLSTASKPPIAPKPLARTEDCKIETSPDGSPNSSNQSPRETFSELQKLLSETIPDFAFLPEIPSDALAKQIAQRWKTKNQSTPISLLFLQEPQQQHKFLTNLATALDVVFGSARLIHAEEIEKENQWEAFLSVPELKLVIICDYALWQMPHLLQFYREVPNQTQRFLLNKPLMLLPDLTLYLKDPQLKRSLWKALCQKIGSI
jgi:hypothetical protein